jgi:uncharacterized cupin superfamily protein
VGLWRSEPATYEYPFEHDEAFHVVTGAATIELPDTGERIEVRAGDVAYFTAGAVRLDDHRAVHEVRRDVGLMRRGGCRRYCRWRP